LGRLGGTRARTVLEVQRSRENGPVRKEIEQALEES
jgi:hypothetical protein